jgi:hypothetical protein
LDAQLKRLHLRNVLQLVFENLDKPGILETILAGFQHDRFGMAEESKKMECKRLLSWAARDKNATKPY